MSSETQKIFFSYGGSMTGELSVDLEDPSKFGQFDRKASGDDLKAFTPTLVRENAGPGPGARGLPQGNP